MKSIASSVVAFTLFSLFFVGTPVAQGEAKGNHTYNGSYSGDYLNRIAFPIGGIGGGMFCLEGTGAISHLSVRHVMEFFSEPCTFAALCVKQPDGNIAKVLEGPVPEWKIFGNNLTSNGSPGKTWGLPRFEYAEFLARFPFCTIKLADPEIPLQVELTGWSPFIPGNADDSCLPVGVLEYRFINNTQDDVDAIFSFNTKNFMAVGKTGNTILPTENGFILWQDETKDKPENEGGLAVFTNAEDTVVDYCWFKGGWWDSLTLAWDNVKNARLLDNPPVEGKCPGASLFVPIKLKPGQEQTVSLNLAWYVPKTNMRLGHDPAAPALSQGPSQGTGVGQQPVTGFMGKGLINTFDSAGDPAVGTLTSPEFKLTGRYIQFLIGGGNHPDKACLQLIVDDKVERSATGKNSEDLLWTTWDISDLKGKKARLQIIDQEKGPWGHINVDHIVMSDRETDTPEQAQQETILHDFEGIDFGDWKPDSNSAASVCCSAPKYHIPWYAARFENIEELVKYWKINNARIRTESALFRDALYDTTLPPEVMEAIAANLTILKSPTVVRQTDGRLWGFEGCSDDFGCCHGSCTHVWNYAQAVPHLFPDLERTLRRTEFHNSQDERGHQSFRSCLPIRPVSHRYHAASDGQLGGIMKIYRDWRISGDSDWMKAIWPKVRQSLDYCIKTWDPRGHGVLEEPHHNTYDIQYWGPDGHCSSFYLGALAAAVEMGEFLNEDVSQYRDLLNKGRRFLEEKLYNGEYFYQQVQTEGLNATFSPLDPARNGSGYKEIIESLNKQGPKYQYGTGCLSDGVLGFWMARVCGLEQPLVDPQKVKSNLKAIHRYNLKKSLTDHPNPQRPTFAMGRDGGLLLCTWPNGGAPALPFVYSDEVWTGIEYQAASHMMMEGLVDEGLEIVRICRDRYDGRIRNPFDEYECGHWYVRALSSYALLQGLTGVRYDAIDKTLYIDSRIGDDFRTFLSTETGFGTVGLKDGKPFLDVKSGKIDVEKVIVSGREMSLK